MAFKITPFQSIDGNFLFHVPPAIQSDFDRYLMTDIPNVTYTMSQIANWYTKNTEAVEIRGEITPIDWKSKYSGSDMIQKFRTSLSNTLHKGDYVLMEDEEAYIVTWFVTSLVNCKQTQIQKCNLLLSFKRNVAMVVNNTTGQKVSDAREADIAMSIPCVGSILQNRYEYSENVNAAGILPSHILIVQTQSNSTTRNIAINDTFQWYNDKYRIVDLSSAEVDVDGYGLLTIVAEKAVEDAS